jgi:hypothetical protein
MSRTFTFSSPHVSLLTTRLRRVPLGSCISGRVDNPDLHRHTFRLISSRTQHTRKQDGDSDTFSITVKLQVMQKHEMLRS